MDNKTANNEVAPKRYQKYKKELIIGGVVVIGTMAVVITYVILKKKSNLAAEIAKIAASGSAKPICANVLSNQVIMRAKPTSPINIDPHLRKLPEGQHASIKQLKLAESLEITVPEGQTFVSGFFKYRGLPDCA